MDVLPSAPISVSATLRLVTSGSDPVLVDSVLTYDRADPFAVRVGFDAGRDALVEWTFARDLLVTGVKNLAGDGDVRVWPSPQATQRGHKRSICLSLSTPSGSALFEVDRASLVKFLSRTFKLVPLGRESEHLDIDGALLALLDESWLSD